MRIILVLIFAVINCESLFSQTQSSLTAGKTVKEEYMVPVAVEQKFVLENPDVKATWKKDGDFYKAQFINPINNLGYITIYDKDGNILRKEKELESQEYPVAISEFYNSNYPGEGFVVWSSTDSTGNLSFYSIHNTETFRFDKDGNLVSPRKKGRADSAAAIQSR
jgi:hypothetical protein